MTSLLRVILNNAKAILSQNKTGAVLALVISILLLKKSTAKPISSIKLSKFLKLLSDDAISKVPFL